jgi:tetratricopeptide (TPR) repeat protein
MPFASSTAPDRRQSTLAGCLLLLAFALYANTLRNGFVYDDHEQLEHNPYVHSLRFAGKIFSSTVWSFQGEQGVTNYYRPLMTLDYLLCHQLFGELPYGYHLVNVFLHVGVVWLVFAVGLQIFADEAAALLAAALFALHPIHTESVAWIAGVTDIELALFYLLAFLLFLRLAPAEPSSRLRIRVGMLASFSLALLSKEQAMTLPVLAAAYEHFVRSDRRSTLWSEKLARYGGFWAVGAAYMLFRATVLGGLALVLQHPDVTWPQAFLSAFALTAQYAAKLFWPRPLSPFYPFHKSVALAEPGVLSGIAVLLGVLALFVLLWKRSRAHAFALLWLLATLGPVMNARWMAASVFAERYLYLPSVAFCWLLAAGGMAMWRAQGGGRFARRPALAAGAVALALLSAFAVVARNRDWHDDTALFTRTLAIHPDASYIRTDLATLLWARGDRAGAERQWLLALESKPDNAVAFSNLGLARLEQKRYDEALAFLARAIQLRPRFAAPHLHRARVYVALGRNAEAEAEFRLAIQIYPLSPESHNALGRFYFDAGRSTEAETEFRASVAASPTAEGYRGLAEIFTQRNLPVEAEQAWRKLLELDPFDAAAHFRLGAIYFASGRRAPAEKEYQAGLLMNPTNTEALAALRELQAQKPPQP